MDLDIITNRDKIIEYCKNSKDIKPVIETSHEFVDGMYFRTMYAPTGSLIVGATHTQDSYEILLKGTLAVSINDKVAHVNAPYTIITKEGSSKIGYCLTDVVYMSIYRTNKTSIDEVEEKLFVEKIYKAKELKCQD